MREMTLLGHHREDTMSINERILNNSSTENTIMSFMGNVYSVSVNKGWWNESKISSMWNKK